MILTYKVKHERDFSRELSLGVKMKKKETKKISYKCQTNKEQTKLS